MRRSPLALLLTFVLAAGCGGGNDPRVARPPATTSSTAGAPTTSETTDTTLPPPAPAPTTPTTEPVVARVVATPSGVVAPVIERREDGFVVSTPCGKTALVANATPLGGTVVLDPGHGGAEPGALGANGLSEKVLNLAVARAAADALQAAGFPTVLTRTADYRMTLSARAKVVEALSPKAFVSIHHNAEPDGPWPGPGSETYYQVVGPSAAASRRLAGLMYEEIVRALGQYGDIGWVADRDAGAKYRTNDRGDDYYGILRRTQGTPATLAELAFISNAAEAELLARPDVQRVEGEAVARAVVRFLTTGDPGSGFTDPYPRSSPAGPGGGREGCVDPPL